MTRERNKNKDIRGKAVKKMPRYWPLYILILFVVAFPFIVDILYGMGILGLLFPNSFSAETWFSFIGSYFPAAILGCLSLYQASIIQEKEMQYRKLLQRHQFVPSAHACVSRYEKGQRRIGEWTHDQVKQMLARCRKNALFGDYHKGYILECGVQVPQGVVIDKFELKEIKWKINKQIFCQDDLKQIANIMKREKDDTYWFTIFWRFYDSDGASEEITRCMLWGTRQESYYEVSWIVLSLWIIDDLGEKYDVRMRFALQSERMEHYKMYSTEESYVVMRGKE